MSVINVTLEDKEIRNLLKRVKKKAGNLTPFMKAIGEIGLFHIELTFRQQQDQFGNPWPKNSAAWTAWKKANNRITATNQDTGMMRSRNTYIANSRECIFTNRDRKAAKRNKIAPFVQFGPDFRQDVIDAGKAYIKP